MVWTPIIITDKSSKRKVHCTLFEAELFKADVLKFDDLWEIYKDDITVKIMNNNYNPA